MRNLLSFSLTFFALVGCAKCMSFSHPSLDPKCSIDDRELDRMYEVLSSKNSWANEAKTLSRSWIKEVLFQETCKNQASAFEHSRKKIEKYLSWKVSNSISNKIDYFLNENKHNEFVDLHADSNDLYWYGVDKEGSPILWYRADKTNFHKMKVKKGIESASIVMQGGIDQMPDPIFDMNFIICFDEFNLLHAMKNPTLGPKFIKTFITVFPDRVKRAYFVTGTIGHMFYNLMNKLAPENMKERMVECRSREEAAARLVVDNVIHKEEIPIFMGGKSEHDEIVVTKYPTMMKTIKNAMEDAILGFHSYFKQS